MTSPMTADAGGSETEGVMDFTHHQHVIMVFIAP